MRESFLLISALKDLRRQLRDLPALVIWIGLPVAIGGLISLLATGDGGTPRAKVLLVDQDESFLSGALAGLATQGDLGGFLEIEPVELEQGRARMDAGEATAMLVLPAGFQDGVLQEQPTRLTLLTNPSQRILPSIVREGLEIIVEAVFYLQRLFGEPLREIAAGPPEGGSFFDDSSIAAISQELNQRAQRLEGVLFPPVLTLELEGDDPEPQTELNFGLIFLPGMIFLSILFLTGSVAGDLWSEREAGTLSRLVSSPQSIVTLLAGKALTAGALTGAAALVGLVIGVLAFDLAWWRAPLAALWSILVGMSLFSLFLVLQTLASSQRTAGLVTNLLIFPLMMLGGSFFPFEALPEWMVAIGRWTPNGAGVTVLRQILDGAVEGRALSVAVAAIAGSGAAAFALCVRRVRGGFARG